MKKLRGKRFLGVPLAIPLVLVLVAVLTVGVVLALAVHDIPSTVTIIDDYGIELYVDDACTVPLETLPWGDIQEGVDPVETVYVKNVGTEIATVTATSGDLPGDMLLVLNGSPVTVGIGEVGHLDLTLDTGTVITGGGLLSFTITFTNTAT